MTARWSLPEHKHEAAFIIGRCGKRKQLGNVLGINQNPSMGRLVNSLLCVIVASVMMLGASVFAASALAAEAGGEPTTEGPVTTEPAGEAPPSGQPAGEAPPSGEPAGEAPASGEPVVEPGDETPAPAEPVTTEPATETPTVTEPVAEAPEQTPVSSEVVEETVKETLAVTEHVVESPQEVAPVIVEQVPVPVERVAPGESLPEQSKEDATPAKSTAEQAAEASPSSAANAPQDAVTAAGSPGPPLPQETSDAPVILVPSGPTGGGLAEPQTNLSASIAAAVPAARLSPAQRAGELSCQLSGLAGPVTEDCTAAWLGSESLLSSSPANLATAAPARSAAPAGGGGVVGYTGGNRSFIPPPGPAPSGAVGGSAAGGSGVATSGTFKLAGLLLHTGPRALRRLRLSCSPWRTAFFVLIPERPG